MYRLNKYKYIFILIYAVQYVKILLAIEGKLSSDNTKTKYLF